MDSSDEKICDKEMMEDLETISPPVHSIFPPETTPETFGLYEGLESTDDEEADILECISDHECTKRLEMHDAINDDISLEEEQEEIDVCGDRDISDNDDALALKLLDINTKPISKKTLIELGVVTEPPFDGAVEGVDYVSLVNEVDEDGNPTGKSFIPADCEHVRSKVDPYYGEKKTDSEKAAELEKYRQLMMTKYGIIDPETGKARISNPDDMNDLKELISQKGWTVRKKVIGGKDLLEDNTLLTGGFSTTPEQQGFQRSGSVPVDMLMFKLISCSNSLVYEMQLTAEIGMEILVHTPHYFALLSPVMYPEVASSYAVLRYAKIFEDMFINKWPFDREHNFTMTGTGMSLKESIPDLSLLSLTQDEFDKLSIEDNVDDKQMIAPTPEGSSMSEIIPNEVYSTDDDNKYVGEAKTEPEKRKLKDFFIIGDDVNINPMDWCPHFDKDDAPESYDKVLRQWFDLAIKQTNKEIEFHKAKMKEVSKDKKSSQEEDVEITSTEEDETKMDFGKKDELDKEEGEGYKSEDGVDDYGDKSVGEPIDDWFCTFGGPDKRDFAAVSAFFRRFVREGWLIKVVERDLRSGGSGGYLLAHCLYQIVEHWKAVCIMDISIAGGSDKLFPGGKESEIKELSEILTKSILSIWGSPESESFSYLNKISDFLACVTTDYVLKRIWKKPEDHVKFNYPDRRNIFKLLMKAEHMVERLTIEDIPLPSCDDCESFHHEWAYHWRNRQLVNLESYLLSELAAKTNNSLQMYAMEMNAVMNAKVLDADVKKNADILPYDALRETMNGSFRIDVSNTANLSEDRLFRYPKFLHEAFLSFHTHQVNKIAVMVLFLHIITSRWVPWNVRKRFGYVPTENVFLDIVKRDQVTDTIMKRHVFMRRTNMQTKLRSVGLDSSSPIYDTLTLREDDTYSDIDLDKESASCLFGDVTYPELDLMTDLLRYTSKIANRSTRPSESDFYEHIKNAISTKAKFILPDNVDVGSQFTSEEMMRMIEVTEKFKNPIANEEIIKGIKRQGKNQKGRRRGAGRRRGNNRNPRGRKQ